MALFVNAAEAKSNKFSARVVLFIPDDAEPPEGYEQRLGSRSVTYPIGETVAALKVYAEGDYSGRLECKTKDEVGDLRQSTNTLIDTLSTTLQEVTDSAEREKQLQAEKVEQDRRQAEEAERERQRMEEERQQAE